MKLLYGNEISEVMSWGYDARYLNRNSFTLENLTEDIITQNTNDEKNKTQYINNIIFIPKTFKTTYECSSETRLQIFHYRLYWFLLGTVSAIFIFPNDFEFYGKLRYILPTAEMLVPFVVLGISYSNVKFFHKVEKDGKNRICCHCHY